MLKVLVKAVGTDLFLKVIRIDVEVSNESHTESFVRFHPFDELKKPNADDMNVLVADTKKQAVQKFWSIVAAEAIKGSLSPRGYRVELCDCDCEDDHDAACEGLSVPDPVTAPAVKPEAPTAPAVQPEPVAEPVKPAAPVAAPVEEPKKRAPRKFSAETKVTPRVEEPVAAPAPAPAPAPEVVTPAEIPSPTTPIGPQYDEEGLEDDPVVVLDLRNQKHMQAIRDTLAGFYGNGWNTDKTAPGYVRVTAHLKSLQGAPFFSGEDLCIAPAILQGFTEILDAHFTRAEAGCV